MSNFLIIYTDLAYFKGTRAIEKNNFDITSSRSSNLGEHFV